MRRGRTSWREESGRGGSVGLLREAAVCLVLLEADYGAAREGGEVSIRRVDENWGGGGTC